jgi:uncharacterized membrane protein
MDYYNLARGLHILAVIAWMAGMLFLPRLFAYDAEQNAKPEPLRGEMQALLRVWQTRLLRIIINPAMILAFVVLMGGVTAALGLGLWHADYGVMALPYVLALGGAWVIHTLGARDALQQQQDMRNRDAAATLVPDDASAIDEVRVLAPAWDVPEDHRAGFGGLSG